MQILIRNIDRSLSEEEVLKLFLKYGKVNSFDLVLDAKTGLSKGFGFADMPNMDEAETAIRELNKRKVGTSVLRVKRAAKSSLLKKDK